MKTILIVDDEKYIRDIYKKIVSACCRSLFRILESDNAVDATGCIVKENIDAVLLDIRMSVVNGQQLYNAIRRWNPKIKVIVVSVYPIEQQKKMIPGADGYYDKSEGPIRLLEKVVNLFSKAEEDSAFNLN